MTLTEAVKISKETKKCFKRIGSSDNCWIEIGPNYHEELIFGYLEEMIDFEYRGNIIFSVEDILADDWITKED